MAQTRQESDRNRSLTSQPPLKMKTNSGTYRVHLDRSSMPRTLYLVMSLLHLLSLNIPETYGKLMTSSMTSSMTTTTHSVADVAQTFQGMSTRGSGVSESRSSLFHFFVTPSNSSGIVKELLLQSQQHQHHPVRVYNWPILVILSCIALAAFWGNVLVCLAVCCKRKLQSMFNCFLVSLALSDMMSAMLVMPLSILKTSVGELGMFEDGFREVEILSGLWLMVGGW